MYEFFLFERMIGTWRVVWSFQLCVVSLGVDDEVDKCVRKTYVQCTARETFCAYASLLLPRVCFRDCSSLRDHFDSLMGHG